MLRMELSAYAHLTEFWLRCQGKAEAWTKERNIKLIWRPRGGYSRRGWVASWTAPLFVTGVLIHDDGSRLNRHAPLLYIIAECLRGRHVYARANRGSQNAIVDKTLYWNTMDTTTGEWIFIPTTTENDSSHHTCWKISAGRRENGVIDARRSNPTITTIARNVMPHRTVLSRLGTLIMPTLYTCTFGAVVHSGKQPENRIVGARVFTLM